MASAAIVTELDRRFGISGVAQVSEGNGGLPRVQVTSPAAEGEMYLHGAQVTSWKPSGAEEVLLLSPHSLWADGHAIRGGVPICFPWFGNKAGDPHAPAHGFVRTKAWRLQSIERTDDAVVVSMVTTSDESTEGWWPSDFRLLHRVTFGRELALELTMTNTDSEPLRFEEALHAYHRVGDATQATLSGLDGVRYLDKTDSYREKTQRGDVVITAETDRVYLDTRRPLEIDDAVLQRRIRINKENSLTTVVWNPWVEQAKAMSDLGEGQWKQMLCVETSNVGDFAVQRRPASSIR